MARSIASEAQTEVERILRERLTTPLASVRVDDGVDYLGEPGLFIKVVFESDPGEPDFEAIRSATMTLRDWLAVRDRPELFPYFSLSTTADEQEDAGTHPTEHGRAQP